MGELSQALGEGQLNLRGPDNKPLEVPRQPLQVLKEPTGIHLQFAELALVPILSPVTL